MDETDPDYRPNDLTGGRVVDDSKVDLHIGRRITSRRMEVGISTTELAGRLGDGSAALIEMNETGVVRVSPARLFDLSRALGVAVTYFFEGL